MNIIVSKEIEQACPCFVGACIEASVKNTPYCEALWDEIEALGNRYRQFLTTDTVKELPGIAATRRVYRACGKDPHAIVRPPKRLSAASCKAKPSTKSTRS